MKLKGPLQVWLIFRDPLSKFKVKTFRFWQQKVHPVYDICRPFTRKGVGWKVKEVESAVFRVIRGRRPRCFVNLGVNEDGFYKPNTEDFQKVSEDTYGLSNHQPWFFCLTPRSQEPRTGRATPLGQQGLSCHSRERNVRLLWPHSLNPPSLSFYRKQKENPELY